MAHSDWLLVDTANAGQLMVLHSTKHRDLGPENWNLVFLVLNLHAQFNSNSTVLHTRCRQALVDFLPFFVRAIIKNQCGSTTKKKSL